MSACSPVFDDAECFGPGECAAGAMCVARRCVRAEAGVDTGPVDAADGAQADGSAPDSTPPAEPDAGPDVGPPGAFVPAPPDAVAFAHHVVAVGDLNGDGFSDLAVADRDAVGPRCVRRCGRVMVYRGTVDGLDPEPWASIDGPGADDERFGQTVSGGSVLGGDAFADLIIGDRRGVTRIVAGGPDGPPSGGADRIATVTLAPPAAPDERPVHFARSTVGDVDGDGHPDLARATVSYVTRLSCGLGSVLGTAAHVHVRVDFGGADGLDPQRAPWIVDDGAFGPASDRCGCTNDGGRVCHMGRRFVTVPGSERDRLALGAPGWSDGRGRIWLLDHARPLEHIDGLCTGQNGGWALATLSGADGHDLLDARWMADCDDDDGPVLIRHPVHDPAAASAIIARLPDQSPDGTPTTATVEHLGVVHHADGTPRGVVVAQADGHAWWVPLPEGEPTAIADLPDLRQAAVLEHGLGGPAFAVLGRLDGLHLVPLPTAPR